MVTTSRDVLEVSLNVLGHFPQPKDKRLALFRHNVFAGHLPSAALAARDQSHSPLRYRGAERSGPRTGVEVMERSEHSVSRSGRVIARRRCRNGASRRERTMSGTRGRAGYPQIIRALSSRDRPMFRRSQRRATAIIAGLRVCPTDGISAGKIITGRRNNVPLSALPSRPDDSRHRIGTCSAWWRPPHASMA